MKIISVRSLGPLVRLAEPFEYDLLMTPREARGIAEALVLAAMATEIEEDLEFICSLGHGGAVIQ